MDAAIAFLVQLVSNGLKSGQLAIAASASSSLGSIYDSKGDWRRAVDCFKQAYEIQLRNGSLRDVAEARVKYGIAAAHIAVAHISSFVARSMLGCRDRGALQAHRQHAAAGPARAQGRGGS